MTDQQKTISVLFKALSEIVQIGTHYPPHWDKYSEQQRKDFPPHQTQAAKIATQALLQVTQEVAP